MIVTPVNDAPTVEAAIGEFTVDEDADRTDIANLDDVFTDLDGDALFYSLIDPPAELGLEIADGVLSVLIQEYLME